MAILPVKKTGATYSTISAAYAAFVDGDIIEIQDSEIYNEQLTIAKDNVIIRAAANCTPTIYHSSYTFQIDHTVVSDFTLRGSSATNRMNIYATGSTAYAIKWQGAINVTCDYIAFSTNASQYALRAEAASTGLITMNDCTYVGKGILTGSFANLAIIKGEATVTDLLVSSATIGGYVRQLKAIVNRITTSTPTWGAGFVMSACYIRSLSTTATFFSNDADGLLLQGNTFVGAGGTSIGFDFYNRNASEIMRNNIVMGFGTGIISANARNYGDYNCWYNNTTNFTNALAGAHDIYEDPIFINDYDLDPYSPCIDAGTSSVVFDYDIDSIPRTGTHDIGCYELSFTGIYYAWQDTIQSIIVEFFDDVIENEELVTSHLNPLNYSVSSNIYNFNILNIEKLETKKVKIWLRNKIVNNTPFNLIISSSLAGNGRVITSTVPVYGTWKERKVLKNETKYAVDIDGVYFDDIGDVDILSAIETLKRFIDNSVLTTAKEFVYDSTFGADYNLKELASKNNLLSLKSSIETSIKKLPNVTGVEVNVIKRVDIIDVEVIVNTDIAIVKRNFDRIIEL
jgi:hypothetical protein